jgi:hypothetical protein
MVDGKSLVGLTHDEAVAVLKATQKLVQLVVATEHMEGESVDSSMQSIPDKMINFLETVQSHQMTASPEAPAVAPEHHKSPLRNTFEFEMKDLKFPTESPSSGLETVFQGTDIKTVCIKRSEGEPLGFSIKQSSAKMPAVFIHAIDPEGATGRTNLLHEGDRLLKANDICLENCSRKEALDILTVRSPYTHHCALLILFFTGIER